MKRLKWFAVLNLCFLSPVASYGSHSLVFLSTGGTLPKDQPHFQQLTVFDDVGISYCDSNTRREQVKPSLQTRHFTDNCDPAYDDFFRFIQNIQAFTNSTVDVVQRRRGCIQSSNGSLSVFDTWAVNGVDFLTFDPKLEKWTSHGLSALTFKKHWNQDKIRNYAFSGYIKQDCPKFIKKITLKEVSRNTEIHVFAKPTVDTDRALLRCHVITTDRSASSVHLVGDGAFRAFWISVIGPVPSGDGSVIFRLTAKISLTHDIDTYGCTLQSGGHNTTVYWDGNTLDHRSLLPRGIPSNSIWFAILGVFCVVTTGFLTSRAIIYLHKCVMMRPHPPPPPPNPELEQQFENFIQSPTLNPALRAILISYVYGTNRPPKEHLGEWIEMMRLRDQEYYDPEFFAGQV